MIEIELEEGHTVLSRRLDTPCLIINETKERLTLGEPIPKSVEMDPLCKITFASTASINAYIELLEKIRDGYGKPVWELVVDVVKENNE